MAVKSSLKARFFFFLCNFFLFLPIPKKQKKSYWQQNFFYCPQKGRIRTARKRKIRKKKKKNACRPAKTAETGIFIIYFAGNLKCAHNHREV